MQDKRCFICQWFWHDLRQRHIMSGIMLIYLYAIRCCFDSKAYNSLSTLQVICQPIRASCSGLEKAGRYKFWINSIYMRVISNLLFWCTYKIAITCLLDALGGICGQKAYRYEEVFTCFYMLDHGRGRFHIQIAHKNLLTKVKYFWADFYQKIFTHTKKAGITPSLSECRMPYIIDKLRLPSHNISAGTYSILLLSHVFCFSLHFLFSECSYIQRHLSVPDGF